MLKPITRLLTSNLNRVPLLSIHFNWNHYKKFGKTGSCECVLHPLLRNDEHIIKTMNDLCDYIRDNYDMDKII